MPLHKPIRGVDGTLLKEIIVPKGTLILPCLGQCNQTKDIWGEDADVWRPARWTDGTVDCKVDNIGPYENLYVLVWLIRFALIDTLFWIGCPSAPAIAHASAGDTRASLSLPLLDSVRHESRKTRRSRGRVSRGTC